MIKNNLDATKTVYFTPDSYWASKYDTKFGNDSLRKGFNISIFGDGSAINQGHDSDLITKAGKRQGHKIVDG